MKIFMVLNLDSFFLSHRKEIALRAVELGYDVTIIAKDTGRSEEIKALGLGFMNLPVNKTGLNPLEEFKTFRLLYKAMGEYRPEIVHLVGLKSILWGGLAARLRRIKGVVSAVCGLGVLFSPEYNVGVRKMISKGVLLVMKYIHSGKNTVCVFHNTDDMDLFVRNGVIARDRCVRTMGSGINLEEYAYVEEPASPPIRVLFTGRMVEEKGVKILIEAAKKLKAEFENRAQFILCGGLDTNPLAVTREWLEENCDGNYIQWLGHRSDVHELLMDSHIFAFPSYYKEGLPKSCIEATAVGRPVITCDSTGCRDTVIDGKTGYLMPVKDSDALADRLRLLLSDASLRRNMGREGRLFAEKCFSVDDVVTVHLEIYRSIS